MSQFPLETCHHMIMPCVFSDMVCHTSLLMGSADMFCHMSMLTWSVELICHMCLLTWSIDIDLPNLMVIVCSPDLMVLIHFIFPGFRFFKSQIENFELRFSQRLTSTHLYTRTKCFSSIMMLD
jgi:hypothetical protein